MICPDCDGRCYVFQQHGFEDDIDILKEVCFRCNGEGEIDNADANVKGQSETGERHINNEHEPSEGMSE